MSKLKNAVMAYILILALALTGCGSKKKNVDMVSSADIPVYDVLDDFDKSYQANKSMSYGVMDEGNGASQVEQKETTSVVSDEPVIKYNYAYTIKDVSIWDNLEHKCFAGYAAQYQKLLIISTDGEHSYVEYMDDNDQIVRGYIPVENYRLLPGTFVSIDLSRQELTLYIDGKLILTIPVVTGKHQVSDTPTGCFAVMRKDEGTTLIGLDGNGGIRYARYVDYWEPFTFGSDNVEIGLHDAEKHTHEDGFTHGWRLPYEFARYTYMQSGSGGCVNTMHDDMEEVFNNTEVGTPVLIHK